MISMPSTKYHNKLILSLLFATVLWMFTSISFAEPIFNDVTVESGITHVSVSDPTTDTGGGVAWIDIDNDGFQDLYVPNPVIGASWLYHNVDDGMGGRTFVEIANLPGSDAHNSAYAGTGVAVGDYDNDGCDDLYITNGGNGTTIVVIGSQRNTLLRNNFCDNGNLTFSDTTVSANLHNEQLNSMVASFGDLDQDGDLDLYVGNYIPDGDMLSGFSTCDLNKLHLNNGDGTFNEVSNLLGVDDRGCTLGVALTDFNNDGKLDIYVTNDFSNHGDKLDTADHFYKNLGNDASGKPNFIRATETNLTDAPNGMGIAIGDYDNDNDLDYYSTSFAEGLLYETFNALNKNNLNLGLETFSFETEIAGVADKDGEPIPGSSSDPNKIGWGTVFFDADNDGFLDLYKANGLVQALFLAVQPNRLFMNNQDGTFREVAVIAQVAGLPVAECQNAFDLCFDQSRGVTVADYDNDGDMDIFVVNTAYGPEDGTGVSVNNRAKLYRNDTFNTNDYLQLRLIGVESNKRGIGAKVRVQSTSLAGTITQMQEVHAGSSHGSTNAFPVHFGFPTGSTVDTIVVEWPMGQVDLYTGADIQLNQITEVAEGQGVVPAPTVVFVISSTAPDAFWGSLILVSGDNFCLNQCGVNNPTETTVTINGKTTTPIIAGKTSMQFYVPVGATGTGPITVTVLGQSGVSAQEITVQISPVPAITFYATSDGKLDNFIVGDLVGVFGSNFCVGQCQINNTTETTITIGGITISPIFVDRNFLLFNVPAAAVGTTGPITVTTLTQESAPSAQSISNIFSPPIITSSSTTGVPGLKFWIGGDDFCLNQCTGSSPQTETTVTVNGVDAQINYIDKNNIIIWIPLSVLGASQATVTTPWGLAITDVFQVKLP